MLGMTTLAIMALHGPVLTNISASAKKTPTNASGMFCE